MAYREFDTPNLSRRALLRGGAWLTAGAALDGAPLGRVAMAQAQAAHVLLVVGGAQVAARVAHDVAAAGHVGAVLVAGGQPCLGPATQAGCGALCPSFGRGCYGCFGPMEGPNLPALSERFAALGVDADGWLRALRTYNAYAGPFRKEAERVERHRS